MEFELTPEEREILRQVGEARDRGDEKEYLRLARKIPLEPAIAKAAKDTFGAQFLIDNGYNLTWANEKYGQDWLTK